MSTHCQAFGVSDRKVPIGVPISLTIALACAKIRSLRAGGGDRMQGKVPAGLLLLVAVCLAAQPAAADTILTLTPANTTTPINSIVTLTATLADNSTGSLGAGQTVTVGLVSGSATPNGPFTGTTDGSGQFHLTFTSLIPVVDDWLASCACGPNGTTVFSNHAYVTFTNGSQVPEPSSMLLLAGGALGLIGAGRRRQG
jgi:hypothetical protein